MLQHDNATQACEEQCGVSDQRTLADQFRLCAEELVPLELVMPPDGNGVGQDD